VTSTGIVDESAGNLEWSDLTLQLDPERLGRLIVQAGRVGRLGKSIECLGGRRVGATGLSGLRHAPGRPVLGQLLERLGDDDRRILLVGDFLTIGEQIVDPPFWMIAVGGRGGLVEPTIDEPTQIESEPVTGHDREHCGHGDEPRPGSPQ